MLFMDKLVIKKVNYMTGFYYPLLIGREMERNYVVYSLLVDVSPREGKLLFNRRKSIMEKLFSLYFCFTIKPPPSTWTAMKEK